MAIPLVENFNNTEAQLAPNPLFPTVSEDVIQTLTRLLAQDINNGIFRFLRADQDGRLLVTSSAVQVSTSQQPVVSVSTVAINLLPQNTSRHVFIVQNLGTNPIELFFGITPVFGNGLQVPANGVFIDDHYLGKIDAIAGSGSNSTRVVEF